jgi:predicted Zn-dependent protease
MRRLLAAALLAASGSAAAGPLLDFRNDLAFSSAEVNALAAKDYAARLRALARAGQLDRDAALGERLQRILPRLHDAALYERPSTARLAWEIHTCSGCDENASAMAGGKLLVSSDFVAQLALSDDELAYLLAHEMAHVLAEHTREFATTARFFVGNGRARNFADIQHELDESLPANLRLNHEYEQEELEADYIGFVLGARAGFAPDAMPSLLKKLRTEGTPLLGSSTIDARRAHQARVMLDMARRIAARSRAER